MTDDTEIRLEMGYEGAEWIQRNLDAMHATAARRPRARCRVSKTMSPLGRTVADVLGFAWRGIYHLPSACLDRVEWHDPRCTVVSVPGDLATFDSDVLTTLVVACFDTLLRLGVGPAGSRHLSLSFWRRRGRTGGLYERLPHLDDHMSAIRSGYNVVTTTNEEKSA